jgi:hypothetical protein
LGFRVVALSPDRPDNMTDSLKVRDLGYSLYSDSTLAAARAFGIVFQLSDDDVKMFTEYGIDLEKESGQVHHQLLRHFAEGIDELVRPVARADEHPRGRPEQER